MAQENPSNPRPNVSGRKWRSNTLCEYFSDRGHDVIRWRSSFSHQRKIQLRKTSTKEKHDNYFHYFIKARSYKKHISIARILSHYQLAKNFYQLAINEEKPDFVHLANVPIELAESVAKYCTLNKIPYIVDIRDLWPDIFVDLIPSNFANLKPFVDKILKIYYENKLYFIFKNAIGITALTNSFLNWSLEKISRDKCETDYILPMSFDSNQNSNKKLIIKRNDVFYKKYNLDSRQIVISYVGNIGYQSDFITIMEAARVLEKENNNIIFIFSGTGPLLESIKTKYCHLKNIRFTGWLEGMELKKLLTISSFGLVIYKNEMNYILNIPNKFPEYLSYGNAIICSTKGEMYNLVEKYKVGFTFESKNQKEFILKLKQFLKNKDSIAKASKSAKDLHKNNFLSSVNYPQYCDFIEDLIN